MFLEVGNNSVCSLLYNWQRYIKALLDIHGLMFMYQGTGARDLMNNYMTLTFTQPKIEYLGMQ